MSAVGAETDALLRQMRGYIRLWSDPPEQEHSTLEQTRARAAQLFVSAFDELNERITRGELLPEAWDQYMQFQPRTRAWGPGGPYVYVYPPGVVGPSPCTLRSRSHGCQWLNPGADKTCCARCHTIRIRKDGSEN